MESISTLNEKTSPRIRTGLFILKGGLNDKLQFCTVGAMPPIMKDGKKLCAKIYISSAMKDKENPEEPDEYLSIRMGENEVSKEAEFNSLFVAFILGIREYSRLENLDLNRIKQGLHKRIDAAWAGYYESQVHNYQFKGN